MMYLTNTLSLVCRRFHLAGLVCIFSLLLSATPVTLSAQIVTNQFTTYKMGGINSMEFTTDNFKCIGLGQRNRIWAGTQYGGLYTYDDGFDTWKKSDKLTNVFINDIKADPDSGIWIAQSGTASSGSNTNIAGGVNYFPVASDLAMEFYSVLGTTTSADLSSRNVRALYIDSTYKAANGQLPRVWAAQGTFITSTNTKRGGISIGLNSVPSYFTNLPGGFSSSSGATPICEAVGGNRQEIWVAVRQNGPAGSQILRYNPTGQFIGFYDTTKTTLPLGFTAQAIYFDRSGNRWIGLKAGGLRIKTASGWLTMNTASLLPAGTQINYNAITENEFGDVFIGTSNGLLEYLSPDYNSSSSPDYSPSYILYTTNDGLPNNNITGLGYDKKNGRLLITSSGGVTFMNQREPNIRGAVFDVTCGPDNDNPYPGLQKRPLSGGLVTARLLKDGAEEDFVYPRFDGSFEFTRAMDNNVYTVEIAWKRNNRTIKYIYSNIRNHTRLQPALIPDGLIDEIKSFKESMEKRCFPLKVTSGAELNFDFFCAKGFKTGLYEDPGEKFYVAEGISVNHKKRVDNLANYFLAMKTVYKLGGDATDIFTDMIANAVDAVQSLGAFVDLSVQIRNENALPETILEKAGLQKEALKKGIVGSIKLIKEGVSHGISKFSSTITDPEKKKTLDKCVGLVNDAADLCLYFIEDGQTGLAVNFFLDNLKKVVALTVAIQYYSKDYTGTRHQYFVPEASLNAGLLSSEKPYEEVFDKLYSTTVNSLAKQSADTLANRKSIIETAGRLSKYAESAGQVFDAARTIAIIPGAQGFASLFTGLSIFAKATRTFALATATYFGAVGCGEIESLSEKISGEAGLQRMINRNIQRPSAITQDAPTALITAKNNYNSKLTELQTVYNSTYDSATYRNKYYEFLQVDSIYSAELNRTLHKLAASTDSADLYVPGFKSKFDKVMDSFITQQYTLRYALYYRNLAYVFDPVKANHSAGLDSLTKDIRLLNDSSVNGISYLINDINSNGIAAPAYLVEDSLRMTHTHVPGSAGTLRYYFTNYGAQPQNNVRFKITILSAGYTITGADSVNVGTIQAGATKQVNFSFVSPMNDSLGHFFIDVEADNGSYKDLYGTLLVQDPAKFYTVKDGNWNDPATWHKNAVPGNTNSVYISHTVTVTADVTCKNVTVYKPGQVIVNTGKRINILQ